MSHKTNRQIFAIPILLGVSTMLGLGAGLIGDDGWDVAAALLLAMPLIVTGWYWTRPTRSRVVARPRATLPSSTQVPRTG